MMVFPGRLGEAINTLRGSVTFRTSRAPAKPAPGLFRSAGIRSPPYRAS